MAQDHSNFRRLSLVWIAVESYNGRRRKTTPSSTSLLDDFTFSQSAARLGLRNSALRGESRKGPRQVPRYHVRMTRRHQRHVRAKGHPHKRRKRQQKSSAALTPQPRREEADDTMAWEREASWSIKPPMHFRSSVLQPNRTHQPLHVPLFWRLDFRYVRVQIRADPKAILRDCIPSASDRGKVRMGGEGLEAARQFQHDTGRGESGAGGIGQELT